MEWYHRRLPGCRQRRSALRRLGGRLAGAARFRAAASCAVRGGWDSVGISICQEPQNQLEFFGTVTDILPYGSTHPAPPSPRVLDAVYCAETVKPVHKPTNHPLKLCTQNKIWLAGLILKQIDDCLSERLLPPFLPGPSSRALFFLIILDFP